MSASRRQHNLKLAAEEAAAAAYKRPPAASGRRRHRFLVCALVLASIALSQYADLTISIASIAMVASDVAQTSLTRLRAARNASFASAAAAASTAATPGTCPLGAGGGTPPATAMAARNRTTGASGHNDAAAADDDERHLLGVVRARLEARELVDWTINERAIVFATPDVAGIAMALPAGYFALRFGAARVVAAAIATSAIRLMLLPVVAVRAPYWATATFQFAFGGLGQTLTQVSYPLGAAWLLPAEASAFVAALPMPIYVGSALTNLVTSQMLASGVAWQWCFYLPGGLATLLAALWLTFGRDQPRESRFVSGAELRLLHASSLLSHTHNDAAAADDDDDKESADENATATACACATKAQRDKCPARKLRRKPNWRKLFTCPIVLSQVAVRVAYQWSKHVRSLLPTFMSNIVHMDTRTIGLLIGLQMASAALIGLVCAFAFKNYATKSPLGWSLTNHRRLNQTIGMGSQIMHLIGLIVFDCEPLWPHVFNIIAAPIISVFLAFGFRQVPMDVSVVDSGLLTTSIQLGAFVEMFALPVSSRLLSRADQSVASASAAGDRLGWRLVWAVNVGVCALALSLFVLFSRSEPKSYSRLAPVGVCESLPASAAARAANDDGGGASAGAREAAPQPPTE